MKNRLLFLLLVCGVSLCAVPPLKNPAWLASATKAAPAGCGQPDDYFADCWDTSATPQANWSSISDASSHLSLDSTVAYGGSAKSLKLTASDNTAAYVQKDLAANQTVNWLQFQCYFVETNWTSGDEERPLYILDASDNVCLYLVVVSEAGRIRYLDTFWKDDGDNWQHLAVNDFIPLAGTWHLIRLHSVAGAGNTGSLQVWYDGVLMADLSGLAWNTYATWRKARFGLNAGTISATYTLNYDNFQWRADSSF